MKKLFLLFLTSVLIPGTIKRKQNSDNDKIKEILKATEKKENSDKINSSVENSILRQIRK